MNNAGAFIGKPFADYTMDDYQKAVAVNVTGFFLMTQRVITAMLKGGGGHVVNISTTMVEHAHSSSPVLRSVVTRRLRVRSKRSSAGGNIEGRWRADDPAQDFNLYRWQYACRGSGV